MLIIDVALMLRHNFNVIVFTVCMVQRLMRMILLSAQALLYTQNGGGNINADTLTLSLTEGFDYTSDYLIVLKLLL